MNTITPERTARPKPYMPSPWDVFYEFARMIFLGCVVTFGPRRGHRKNRLQEFTLLHSRLGSFTLEASTTEAVRDTVDAAERPVIP